MDNVFAYESRRFQYGTGVERQYGKLDHEYEGTKLPLWIIVESLCECEYNHYDNKGPHLGVILTLNNVYRIRDIISRIRIDRNKEAHLIPII